MRSNQHQKKKIVKKIYINSNFFLESAFNEANRSTKMKEKI